MPRFWIPIFPKRYRFWSGDQDGECLFRFILKRVWGQGADYHFGFNHCLTCKSMIDSGTLYPITQIRMNRWYAWWMPPRGPLSLLYVICLFGVMNSVEFPPQTLISKRKKVIFRNTPCPEVIFRNAPPCPCLFVTKLFLGTYHAPFHHPLPRSSMILNGGLWHLPPGWLPHNRLQPQHLPKTP